MAPSPFAGLLRSKASLGALVTSGMASSLATGSVPASFEGWLASTGAVGASVVFSVASGIFSNRVQAALDDTGDLNGHLARATGAAVSRLVRAGATEESASPKTLERLADAIDSRHEPGGKDHGGIDGVGPEEAAAFFDDPEGFGRKKALSREAWLAYLKGVAEDQSIDVWAIDLELFEIAGILEEHYVRSLYHVLQADYADKGKAFGGMLVRLIHRVFDKLNVLDENVREGLVISKATKDGVLQLLDQLPGAFEEARSERAEFRDSLQAVLELLPNLVPKVSDLELDKQSLIQATSTGDERFEDETRQRKEDVESEGVQFWPVKPRVDPIEHFVGRDEDRRILRAELEAGTKVITMVGPPGTGKTTLAVQLMEDVADLYPDGCCYVTFASLQYGDLVLQEIAEQFGRTDFRERPPSEVLIEHLVGRKVLLVLDNCEHVFAESLAAVRDLRRAPGLQIVTTSRRGFGLDWELTYEVGPLHVPESTDIGLAELSESPAISLFATTAANRIKDGRRAFQLSEGNSETVLRLCRLVAGLPLAIKLVASLVHKIPLEELAQDLSHIIGKISDGPAEGRRDDTMSATIQRSYEALDDDVKQTFRRLSVFDGGWSLEASRFLIGADADRHLGELLDSSLISQDDQTYRRWYLEPIRLVAETLLKQEGEYGETRAPHRDWYLQFAEGLEPLLLEEGKDEAIEDLEIEHDNLRRSVRWSIEEAATLESMRMAAALWRFWETRGYLREGRTILERVLAMDPGTLREDPIYLRARCAVLGGDATMAYRQGLPAKTAERSAEALEIANDLGDRVAIGDALIDLGNAKWAMAHLDEAVRAYTRALELFAGANERRLTAVANFNLGGCYLAMEDHATARGHLDRSLAGFREDGNDNDAPYPLTALGLLASYEGHHEDGRSLILEGLRMRKSSPRGLGDSRDALGTVARLAGDLELAAIEFRVAWDHRSEVDDKRGMVRTLDGLALLSEQSSASRLAVRMYAATTTFRTRVQVGRLPREVRELQAMLERAEDKMGAAVYEENLARGRKWSPETAIEEAFRA